MTNKINIGGLSVKNVLPSPLSGYTDYPFRKILKNCGADLVAAEMVSVESIVRKNKNSERILFFDEYQKPIMVQLFGNEPLSFAKAVEIILNNNLKPDIIDINLGCSVRKILKSKSGSYLLTEPKKIEDIIKAIKKVTDICLTAKIRAGWDDNSLNYVEVGRILEDNGCNAVTFHPRTTKDLFKHTARWEYIKKLKKRIKIPVIGNGDIKTEEDAFRMLKETGCDGIMIGRAIMGNPFIIKKTIAYFETGKKIKIKLTELFDTIKMHLRYFHTYYGEKKLHCFRKHLFKYLKGVCIEKDIKERLLKADSLHQLEEELHDLAKSMVV